MSTYSVSAKIYWRDLLEKHISEIFFRQLRIYDEISETTESVTFFLSILNFITITYTTITNLCI